MKRKILALAALAMLGAILVAPFAHSIRAQVPRTISYQGVIKNNGVLINESPHITVALYDSPTGGSAIYREDYPSVTVTNGIFDLTIGSETPFPPSLTFDKQYWVGLSVNGEAEMTPRAAL